MIDLTYLPQLIIAYYGNDLIHINNADKDKEYTCPCCGNIVKPRAFNSEMKQPHYYHLNSECNKESQIHWLYKNYLFKPGSKFIIENIEYEVDSIEIEKSWNTTLGIYRPDITVYTKCNKKIFFELYFTNNNYDDVMLYYKKIYPEDNYIDIIQEYNKKSEEKINKYNELKDLSQKINKCKNELWCSNIRFNIFKNKIEFIIMLKKYPKFYRKIDFNLSLNNLKEQILKAFNSILYELESCGIRIIFEGEV